MSNSGASPGQLLSKTAVILTDKLDGVLKQRDFIRLTDLLIIRGQFDSPGTYIQNFLDLDFNIEVFSAAVQGTVIKIGFSENSLIRKNASLGIKYCEHCGSLMGFSSCSNCHKPSVSPRLEYVNSSTNKLAITKDEINLINWAASLKSLLMSKIKPRKSFQPLDIYIEAEDRSQLLFDDELIGTLGLYWFVKGKLHLNYFEQVGNTFTGFPKSQITGLVTLIEVINNKLNIEVIDHNTSTRYTHIFDFVHAKPNVEVGDNVAAGAILAYVFNGAFNGDPYDALDEINLIDLDFVEFIKGVKRQHVIHADKKLWPVKWLKSVKFDDNILVDMRDKHRQGQVINRNSSTSLRGRFNIVNYNLT